VRLIRAASAAEFDRCAADVVCAHVIAQPGTRLALPTGRTPQGLYLNLQQRTAAELAALRAARYVNLDEYLGVGPGDARSYAHFLQRQVFGPLGIAASQLRLLRGDAPDPQAECLRFEDELQAGGGLGLAILGLGANGHIAFNEPGTAWNTRTHVAALSAGTLAVNERLSGGLPLPQRGLTLGIATLKDARSVLLLAAGESKAAALQRLLLGTPDLEWPATSLIGHRDLTVICSPELGAVLPATSARTVTQTGTVGGGGPAA
jgi:glucosamine-6-phosphate deaminase